MQHGIIEQIHTHATKDPNRSAYELYDASGEISSLSWKKLDEWSDALAVYLHRDDTPNDPVVVYGHKSIYKPVCFLACVKAGRACCPVDSSIPSSRVQNIVDCVASDVVLATEEIHCRHENILPLRKIKE